MKIRLEEKTDRDEIRDINVKAFGSNAEASLIDSLRKSDVPLISLVAEKNGKLIGHIVFSPVTLQGCKVNIAIAGLAPMAVLPEWQQKGIGERLVEEGF